MLDAVRQITERSYQVCSAGMAFSRPHSGRLVSFQRDPEADPFAARQLGLLT
jgi:hypothetical protein